MITNSKDSTLVSGSKGNDIIGNYGNYVTVKADAGNDWIGNYGKNSVIIAGTGNDTVLTFGDNTLIDTNKGNDFIYCSSSTGYATVKTGTGNDTIEIVMNTNYDYYGGYYYGGATRSDIKISDLKNTDTIYLYHPVSDFDAYIQNGELVLSNRDYTLPGLISIILPGITSKEKFEKIKGIKIINGDITTTVGNLLKTNLCLEDNIKFYGTSADDKFIRVYSKNNIIYGLNGNDFIILDAGVKNSTVYGGNGNDDIWGNGENVVLYGDSGNDYISFHSKNATINGGDGNDNIHVDGDASNVTVHGGRGDDYFIVDVFSENITLTGGVGKDTVALSYWDTVFSGSDNSCEVVINDLKSSEDTLLFGKQIDSITAYRENDNLILKDNDGFFSVTLTGVTSTDEIKDVVVCNNGLNGSGGTKTTIGELLTNAIKCKKTQLDVIKDFMSSLDKTELKGVEAVDEAVKFASSDQFENYSKLIETFVADCKKLNDSETFLKNYCGIDLNNDDTGAITGWDAGGIDVKTAESIVSEKGNLKKYSKAVRHEDKNSGLALIWNEPKVKNSTVTSTQKKIVQGLDSWWFEGALSLITETYGMNFKKENGATVNEITLISKAHSKEWFSDEYESSEMETYLKSIPAITWNFDNDENGVTDSLYFYFNDEIYKNMNLNKNANGSVKNETYLDRVISHELTHAVMGVNIKYFHDLPNIILEGMAEVTHGGDFRNVTTLVNNIKSIDTNTATNVIINDDSKTLINENDSDYTTGYVLLRYLAKQVSKKSGIQEGVKCSGDKTSIKLTSEFKGTFKAGEYFSNIKNIDASRDKNSVTIYGNAKDNNILGGSGKDKLYGYSGKDVLNGGAGNDVLTGGKGNDNLTGGKGKDIFVYANGDGKDTITDYTAGQDKIKITKGSIGSFKITGTDVVFTIGKGTINIKNGAGKKITVIDSNGKETSKVYGISRKVSSLWFADEDTNFSISSTQIDSITKNEWSDYSLGNIEATTDWTAFTPKDSLTSGLTFSEK